MNWMAAHIFGTGQIHVVTDSGELIRVEAADYSGCVPVVEMVSLKKPKDFKGSEMHAINIFKGLFVDFAPVSGESFRVEWNDFTESEAAGIESLVSSIISNNNL